MVRLATMGARSRQQWACRYCRSRLHLDCTKCTTALHRLGEGRTKRRKVQQYQNARDVKVQRYQSAAHVSLGACVRHGQTWSDMVRYGQIRSDLNAICPAPCCCLLPNKEPTQHRRSTGQLPSIDPLITKTILILLSARERGDADGRTTFWVRWK